MLFLVLLTTAAVAGLLAGERSGARPAIWIAKPLASTGFIAFALACGALDSTYGQWVLAALVLSWLGDVLLIPQDRPQVFQAGVLSFLLAHVAYAIAFGTRGLDVAWMAVAVALVAPAIVVVLRWLRPHLPPDMAVAVYAYMIVITAMVVCAAGSVGAAGNTAILVGALGFYLSDLSVAKDRFVDGAFSNRLWGLPLYYGAQLLLAWTVVAARPPELG